jgi:hypothetical protein
MADIERERDQALEDNNDLREMLARSEAEVERLRRPTHICLDCGAVGYAGGYHDHGGGNAGDTASIAAVLEQLLEVERLRTALLEIHEIAAREWKAGGGNYARYGDIAGIVETLGIVEEA